MKKTLLFILCLAGMTSLSNATVTTIDCSTVTWNTSVKNEISGSAEGFDISAVKNNGQTPPTYNTSAKDVRIYAKGSITITSTSGKPITNIAFGISTAGKKRLASCTAEPGTVTVKGDPDFTCEWSGSSASVTITVGDKADFGTDSGKAGQLDFTSITITTNDEAAGQVAQPTITPGSSYILGESTEVTLECSTDGAKIYYTTDGSEPSESATLYNEPFPVSETCTVKAIAIKEGLTNSSIAEATYSVPGNVANIAEYMSTAKENTAYKITGPVTVVYQNDINLYIQDESGSLLVYGDAVGEYKEGDVITGLIGEYGVYQDITQMLPLYAPDAVSGTPAEPVTMNISEITTADVYKYIKLSEAVFKEDATFETGKTTNGIVVSGDKEMTIRNSFRVIDGTFEASKKWDIIGFVSVYQGTPQIYPISITESTLDGVKAATTDDNITIYSSNGKIYVNAIGGEKIELFNITGQKVAEKVAVSGINVLDAVYDITLVKVGSKVVKVVK